MSKKTHCFSITKIGHLVFREIISANCESQTKHRIACHIWGFHDGEDSSEGLQRRWGQHGPVKHVT